MVNVSFVSSLGCLLSAVGPPWQQPAWAPLPVTSRHGRGGLGGSLGDGGQALYREGEHWLAVPLDWSAPATHAPLKIRYHVDATHFNAQDPHVPIFLRMGGDGTVNHASCGEASVRHGALCVSVEHRFYGLSVPPASVGGCFTANYVAGLSVENALADAARSSMPCAATARGSTSMAVVSALWSRSASRTVVHSARGSVSLTRSTQTAAWPRVQWSTPFLISTNST
ncbi:hypothetical protein T492DRAFT_196457 [Pavlovales sp. CCMP2436]|nr:hypothetical protein T492DRAFT_196457 [Pavlovales sp. CCMP2436]